LAWCPAWCSVNFTLHHKVGAIFPKNHGKNHNNNNNNIVDEIISTAKNYFSVQQHSCRNPAEHSVTQNGHKHPAFATLEVTRRNATIACLNNQKP
jgi:hypothetical protein